MDPLGYLGPLVTGLPADEGGLGSVEGLEGGLALLGVLGVGLAGGEGGV